MKLNGSVLPSHIQNNNVGAKGFLSPNYVAYLGAKVDVYTIEDLRLVQNFYQQYTADMTVAIKADLAMTEENQVNTLYVTASIDGEGHTISG